MPMMFFRFLFMRKRSEGVGQIAKTAVVSVLAAALLYWFWNRDREVLPVLALTSAPLCFSSLTTIRSSVDSRVIEPVAFVLLPVASILIGLLYPLVRNGATQLDGEVPSHWPATLVWLLFDIRVLGCFVAIGHAIGSQRVSPRQSQEVMPATSRSAGQATSKWHVMSVAAVLCAILGQRLAVVPHAETRLARELLSVRSEARASPPLGWDVRCLACVLVAGLAVAVKRSGSGSEADSDRIGHVENNNFFAVSDDVRKAAGDLVDSFHLPQREAAKKHRMYLF